MLFPLPEGLASQVKFAQLSLVQVVRKLDIVTIHQTKKYPR